MIMRLGTLMCLTLMLVGCRKNSGVCTSLRDPNCAGSTAATGETGITGATGPTNQNTGPVPIFVCTCSVGAGDQDGDCEPDAVEDTNGNGIYDSGVDYSDPSKADTDGDGIPDGCEDINHNGVVDAFPPEGSPTNADSDGDGVPDGLEDTNKNGRCDPGEACSTASDSDHDGIDDGVEDRNHNGVWDCPEDPAGPPCETRSDAADTDDDGLLDSLELKAFADPANPIFRFCVASACSGVANARCEGAGAFEGRDGVPDTADDQTCPWQADSDFDGIADGLEDRNSDGRVSTGESNPRKRDSDGDGLDDGVEDANHDGVWDAMTETDPSRLDTDRDGISDGIEDSGGCLTLPGNPPTCSGEPSQGPARCICGFWRDGRRQALESDPRLPDTDGDGLKDGAEDRNGDGICQLPAPRDVPRASDETCAFDNDSDDDSLLDGAEDVNGNGLIDAALNETDARRGDPDNDCLTDPYEMFTGTDPFRADTDDDGLPDGLETDQRMRFDPISRTCVPIACASTPRYATATCPDPTVRDSDGDGFVDGFELINGVTIGEDENADGCTATIETNPCADDAVEPPIVGDPTSTVCTLRAPLICAGVDLRKCDTCSVLSPPSNFCGGDSSTCPSEGLTCPDNAPCKQARKLSQALICAEGNIRPVVIVRSADNDYSVALAARAGAFGIPESLFDFAEARFAGGPVGHLYRSRDDISNTPGNREAIRSVFGGVMRMGTFQLGEGGAPDTVLDDPQITIVDGTGTGRVISTASLVPSDVAAIAFDQLRARLNPMGLTLARTAGGTVTAHDDESGSGRPNPTLVTRALDRYVVRRADAGEVDTQAVSAAVGKALIGGNVYTSDLPPVSSFTRGPIAELKISYYKRVVKKRVYNEQGVSRLVDVAQFGAMWAIAALDQDCSSLAGSDRAECRERNESALNPVDDLSNGSAFARFQAEVGRGCDAYDPKKAKVDFLVVLDDSVSMQSNIVAIQRAVRDASFKLRANAENMDWRIGMTTSNMGGGQSHTALLDPFEPYVAGQSEDYPVLRPSSPPPAAESFIAYQSTAYDNDGSVKACEYGADYSLQNPLVSPFCCRWSDSSPNASAPGLTYLRDCCSMPQGTVGPVAYSGAFDLSDADSSSYGPNFSLNDTLRCYDFPRFAEDLSTWAGVVSRYPTAATGLTPTAAQRERHFNDYLCSVDSNVFQQPSRGPIALWGTRGFLWPPGFAGYDKVNPRRDGANLLIRNADMLVTQMNRDCTGNDANGNFIWSPRTRNGSGAESMLQAAKRAVERATADGRTGTAKTLRSDAPLITILLSDEDDFSTKFRNGSSNRDETPLPPARCLLNGDLGCTALYCQGCFADAIDEGASTAGNRSVYAVPAARRYDETTDRIREDAGGAFCTAPIPPAGSASTNAQVSATCPSPGASTDDPFCAAGPNASLRYSGFFKVGYNQNENGPSATEQGLAANGIPADVLNYTAVGADVSCGCTSDCQPCMRYLRERQYIDYFSGLCSPSDVSAPSGPVPNDDPRRYPRPAASLSVGNLMLPLGPIYAITRAAGYQGGVPGACGSDYSGGDGQALRDVALATGGSVADICPTAPAVEPSYAEFLDQILVEAQGIGSPYRLRGNPISSTIRVGVMDRLGKFRILKRSSVSGFDYNPTTNTVAFFSKGDSDSSNQVTLANDAVVYVSYRVWTRQCPEDCALGDVCAICTCSPSRPECCTTLPTLECQPPNPCSEGCGPCQECNFATNQCRSSNPCGNACGGVCATSPSGPACQPSCPSGTVGVVVPCDIPAGSEAACPDKPLTVCVTQDGVPNTGTSCAVTTQGNDCCGANKECTGNDVCVLTPCDGESCLPTATCQAPGPSGRPQTDWCGAPCPAGTVCAPVPCQGSSCPPKFACIASNPGSSATCDPSPECNCPNAVCSDCDLGKYCNAAQRCVDLCDPPRPVAECCTTPGVRAGGLSCCPPGETFNPATGMCTAGGFSCNCPPEQFCDPFSGRCFPRGG